MRSNHRNNEYCRKIAKDYGQSYYLATAFFPKGLRQATYALYAFFRVADDYVDHYQNAQSAKKKLTQWRKDWLQAYREGRSDNPILAEAQKVFQHYAIPLEYSLNFLKAMEQDLIQTRYKNYKELEGYMAGSAVAIAKAMAYVIGFNDSRILEYAQKLGQALQLTNFIRDIGEDIQKRKRIYLPLTELSSFKVTTGDIDSGYVTPAIEKLLKYQITRARRLYAETLAGLRYLPLSRRLPIKLAARLYSAILKAVEKNHYDVFTKRARVPWRQKLIIVIQEILRN